MFSIQHKMPTILLQNKAKSGHQNHFTACPEAYSTVSNVLTMLKKRRQLSICVKITDGKISVAILLNVVVGRNTYLGHLPQKKILKFNKILSKTKVFHRPIKHLCDYYY